HHQLVVRFHQFIRMCVCVRLRSLLDVLVYASRALSLSAQELALSDEIREVPDTAVDRLWRHFNGRTLGRCRGRCGFSRHNSKATTRRQGRSRDGEKKLHHDQIPRNLKESITSCSRGAGGRPQWAAAMRRKQAMTSSAMSSNWSAVLAGCVTS